MKKREIVRRCQCPCNRELPSRYKGRLKIFFDSRECRKTWHDLPEADQLKRLKQMDEDIKKENKRLKKS